MTYSKRPGCPSKKPGKALNVTIAKITTAILRVKRFIPKMPITTADVHHTPRRYLAIRTFRQIPHSVFEKNFFILARFSFLSFIFVLRISTRSMYKRERIEFVSPTRNSGENRLIQNSSSNAKTFPPSSIRRAYSYYSRFIVQKSTQTSLYRKTIQRIPTDSKFVRVNVFSL